MNLAALPVAFPSAVADRAALARAVDVAINATDKRSTYAILSHVRLTGDGNTMFVTGTDLDLEVVVAVPAAADSSFDVSVPADLMKSLLKGAPKSEHVAFTAPEAAPNHHGTLEFTGAVVADFDRASFDLIALHPSAWPDMKAPGHNSARRFALPGAALLDALSSVSPAMSSEETRYYLNGICVHHNAGQNNPGLRFVATDGHRLLGQVTELPEGAESLPQAIWPKQLVLLLQKLMKGKTCPESVAIQIDETRIRISFDDITITSKLIEGSFPDVDRVTPRHNDKIVRASIAALQEAAATVALIGGKTSRAVKLSIEAGECVVSAQSGDKGAGRMAVPVSQEFDGSFEIGFNARYVDDILDVAAVGGDDLALAFNDAQAPILITSSKPGWYAVLMPMRC